MKFRFFIFIIIVSLVVFSSVHAAIPKHRTFELTYKFTIKDLPSGVSDLKVWAPYPPNTSCQSVEKIDSNIGELFSIMHDKKYKNKLLYSSIKSPKDSSLKFNIRYKVKRNEYSHKPEGALVNKEVSISSELEKYLEANKLVTLSPRVRELAASITEDKSTTMDKARAIYDYVFENMSYDKTVPGWGFGDTERACDMKTGNCTDFHSFFISLCRASGIPAKFLIGIKLSKKNKGQAGYHCWAEFYVEGFGWVPVDISEAWKDKSKKEYYFGTLCEDRIEFTHGRDIILEPAQDGEPLNYLIYPYVEIDGKVYNRVETTFEFRNIEQEY